MKRLDRLIIFIFLPTFFITLSVILFILLSHFLINYFNDFIGKNLNGQVYVELFTYFTLNMMPMALPISLLLSSLMVFGGLGEHNELTAIKSAGISLLRVIFPVFVLVVFICIGSYFFNNHVLPFSNLKAYSLLYDIRTKKAALNIKEGSFYNGLPGYSVKVNKKESNNRIKEVMIYDHQEGRGNVSLIVADSGKMYTILGDRYLVLELFSGKNFSEGNQNSQKTTEFVVNEFAETKLYFSLSSFELTRTQIELFANNRIMRKLDELFEDKDSMKRDIVMVRNNMVPNLNSYFSYLHKPDTMHGMAQAYTDSILTQIKVLSADQIEQVLAMTQNNARNIQSFSSGYFERVSFLNKEVNLYWVEIFRKFTQPLSCLVLFLIGAPVGAIIKKGGFGVPVIMSIVFFIIFYILSTTGEKWTKEAILSPAVGMLLAPVLLGLAGLFFLFKARNDSNLFDFSLPRMPKWLQGKSTPADKPIAISK